MNTQKLWSLAIFAVIVFGAMQPVAVSAHCEIPCGIYGDRMRVDMLEEHFRTVEKSMKMIRKLEKKDPGNANQLVRWVVNKDEHANKIQTIVYQYFMNQRIKPAAKKDAKAYNKYVKEITLLHRMLVQAMKCKQTTDKNHVQKLRKLLDAFDKSYFADKKDESAGGKGKSGMHEQGEPHGHMHGEEQGHMYEGEHHGHMHEEEEKHRAEDSR
jgi:nickel superoxide dismutase